MSEALAETTRGSRDRLKGQPQERQHSAAARDAGPTASGERLESDFATYCYQFYIYDFMILFQCCACRCAACACSLSPFFCRGRHGQESEEGKEDREGSHQEGGKEDQEKEVVVSATEKLPPPGRNLDTKRNLSKGSKMSFTAVQYRGKAL
jgi:hypothetical protein